MSSYQLLKILDLKMYIPHIEKMGKFKHIQHNIQANLQYSKEKILIFHVYHLCDWGKLSIFHFESGAFAGSNRASKLGIQEKFPVKLDPYHPQQHSFVLAPHMTQWLDPSGIFTGTSWYNECGLTGVPFNSVNSNYENISILLFADAFVYEVLSVGSDGCNA